MNSNIKQDPILSLVLKPSLTRQTALWGRENETEKYTASVFTHSESAAHRPAWRWPELMPSTGGHPGDTQVQLMTRTIILHYSKACVPREAELWLQSREDECFLNHSFYVLCLVPELLPELLHKTFIQLWLLLHAADVVIAASINTTTFYMRTLAFLSIL